MTLVDSNGNILATASVTVAPLSHFQADVSGTFAVCRGGTLKMPLKLCKG